MKASRRIFIAAIITLSALGSVVYSSCKNKCGSTTCQNGGSCADNVCICPTGYSGNACQTGWSDASIGTYNCKRGSCSPAVAGDSTWVSSVTKSSVNGGYTINISNFDNSNTTIVGTIDSAIGGINKIVISPAAGSYGINASGTYENGTISLHFTTASVTGGIGYTCTMTMKKQ